MNPKLLVELLFDSNPYNRTMAQRIIAAMKHA